MFPNKRRVKRSMRSVGLKLMMRIDKVSAGGAQCSLCTLATVGRYSSTRREIYHNLKSGLTQL